MRNKAIAIPVNYMATESGTGISIERFAISDVHNPDEAIRKTVNEGSGSHRHDGHAFFLLETGSITVEIDFQIYTITAPSVIYIHADQVHRTLAAENITVSSLAITDENLNPEYRSILEGITPAQPLVLNEEMFVLISESVSLCLKFAERKSEKLHHAVLKNSCNALVALIASQYLALAKSPDKLSRFETVTKAFRQLLEKNYTAVKAPADYAEKLNISAPYLNECVKNTTGYPVSHFIQQRVILEAKRLLYYSDLTIKEIAAVLGYDDYPYFSRLFTKVTGMTAITFRNKNRD